MLGLKIKQTNETFVSADGARNIYYTEIIADATEYIRKIDKRILKISHKEERAICEKLPKNSDITDKIISHFRAQGFDTKISSTGKWLTLKW
jgi:hypothetical protein